MTGRRRSIHGAGFMDHENSISKESNNAEYNEHKPTIDRPQLMSLMYISVHALKLAVKIVNQQLRPSFIRRKNHSDNLRITNGIK